MKGHMRNSNEERRGSAEKNSTRTKRQYALKTFQVLLMYNRDIYQGFYLVD
jgi:hypothetical protein